MEITNVSITTYEDKNSNLKAFARVTIDDQLVLTGIKLIEGKKGLFIGFPSIKAKVDKEDKYYDIFYASTREFRDELTDAIIYEYDNSRDNKKRKTR